MARIMGSARPRPYKPNLAAFPGSIARTEAAFARGRHAFARLRECFLHATEIHLRHPEMRLRGARGLPALLCAGAFARTQDRLARRLDDHEPQVP